MLPIVQRELRTAARDPRLYKGRVRLGAVMILAAAVLLVSVRPGAARGAPGGFFWFLAWLAFLFCLLEGVRKTSDAISAERREGTLGFLFLTDLGGADVALGKWAGALIRSLSGLLAFVPVLAVTLLLGGTTAWEFWRAVLALVLALAVSLSLCLALSALRRERGAGLAMAVLAALCAVPPLAGEALRASGLAGDDRWIDNLSPACLLAAASDASVFRSSRSFWLGVLAQCGIVFSSLALASFVTPRVWQDKPARSGARLKARTRGGGGARARRGKLLDRNPILWLAFSERQHRLFTILFMSVAGFFALVAAIFFWERSPLREEAVMAGIGFVILTLIFAVQMASQASGNLAEARRNGTLELLLSTPLKVRDIVRGQWLALRRMFLPAALVLLAFGLFIALSVLRETPVGTAFYAAKFGLELVLEYFVLGWVGMWSGLAAKSPNGAFFRTIVLGLFAPFLICTPTLLNQLVLIVIASDKVKARFRRFVAEKYLQDPTFVLPPALAGSQSPPVIR